MVENDWGNNVLKTVFNSFKEKGKDVNAILNACLLKKKGK